MAAQFRACSVKVVTDNNWRSWCAHVPLNLYLLKTSHSLYRDFGLYFVDPGLWWLISVANLAGFWSQLEVSTLCVVDFQKGLTAEGRPTTNVCASHRKESPRLSEEGERRKPDKLQNSFLSVSWLQTHSEQPALALLHISLLNCHPSNWARRTPLKLLLFQQQEHAGID